MITDGIYARSPATTMRDFLRNLERQTITPPARPNNPPTTAATFTALSTPETAEPTPVVIGAWTLAEDPDSGDLVAVHADGTTRTLATKGAS